MARGRRASYTTYLECHYRGCIVFIRYKAYFRKDDVSKEVHEIIRDERTIQEARENGFPIRVITDEGCIPSEAIREAIRRESA